MLVVYIRPDWILPEQVPGGAVLPLQSPPGLPAARPPPPVSLTPLGQRPLAGLSGRTFLSIAVMLVTNWFEAKGHCGEGEEGEGEGA